MAIATMDMIPLRTIDHRPFQVEKRDRCLIHLNRNTQTQTQIKIQNSQLFNSTNMVHGKQGLRLEAFKFGIYLLIPISASLTFNDPRVQRWAADYFQFLKYPSNPNTNLKEEFEELMRTKQEEKEQRRIYAEQLQKLQESARASRLSDGQDSSLLADGSSNSKKGWFSWMGSFRSSSSQH
jgi:hypothetical protein